MLFNVFITGHISGDGRHNLEHNRVGNGRATTAPRRDEQGAGRAQECSRVQGTRGTPRRRPSPLPPSSHQGNAPAAPGGAAGAERGRGDGGDPGPRRAQGLHRAGEPLGGAPRRRGVAGAGLVHAGAVPAAAS